MIKTSRIDNRVFTEQPWVLSRPQRSARLRNTLAATALLGLLLAAWSMPGSHAVLAEWAPDGTTGNEVESLRERADSLQRRLEIEQATRKALESELAAMNERAAKLKDELNFIRNAQAGH